MLRLGSGFVGGSIASILHGEIRTTFDADLIVELREADVPALRQCLSAAFFVDIDGAQRLRELALQERLKRAN